MTGTGAWTADSPSPEATLEIGRRLGRAARPGDCVALAGDLGAGKTVLAKGMAEGLRAASAREVASPTFVLCREYLDGRIPFYHLDAYRLRGAADLEAIGAAEILAGDGLAAVEWADRAPEALPADRLDVRLEVTGPASRHLTFTPRGPRSRELLAALQSDAM